MYQMIRATQDMLMGKNIGTITAYGSENKKHAVFSIAVGRPISWSLKIMLFYLFSFSITYIIRLP